MDKFTVVNGITYAPEIDPSDKLDYTMDFASLLGVDTINTVTWSATAGVTIDSGKESNTNTTATVWLKDGVVGETATVTCRIVTVGLRTIERSFKIQCKNL